MALMRLRPLLCSKRLLLIGGKGGVGKTTLSTALALGTVALGRRVLLISTDPAHSLSDLLLHPIGHEAAHIMPNFSALELDPAIEVDAYLTRTLAQMSRYVHPDQRSILQQQLDLARQAPGAEEAALLERLCTLIQEGLAQYDLIILDTAPTGHTLRLLSLPEIMATWTEGLLGHQQRAQHLNSVISHLSPKSSQPHPQYNDQPSAAAPAIDSQIAQTLAVRQTLFRNSRRLLSDPEQSGFIFALTPERLPILETERAWQTLMAHNIPILGLLINRVLPQHLDSNDFWRGQLLQQRLHLQDITARLGALPQRQIPWQAHPILGLEALAAFGQTLLET